MVNRLCYYGLISNKHEPLAKGHTMEPKVRYNGERNGYSIKVYEYMRRDETRYNARIVNLTTGDSEETPGWSSYGTALLVAQQTADEAQI